MNNKSRVCVFCGAQNAVPQKHLDVGKDLGAFLADNGNRLVYGGGDCGIMGATANATLDNGGEVTGVFPRWLDKFEKEHQGLTEIHVVDTMHERKQIMYENSDMFVILPGGCGTMDEFFEILTWAQLEVHAKPIIIFNHDGYWTPLVNLLDNIIEKGFAKPVTSDYYTVVETYDEMLEAIKAAG